MGLFHFPPVSPVSLFQVSSFTYTINENDAFVLTSFPCLFSTPFSLKSPTCEQSFSHQLCVVDSQIAIFSYNIFCAISKSLVRKSNWMLLRYPKFLVLKLNSLNSFYIHFLSPKSALILFSLFRNGPATAAAKLLQLCPTLCDPIDGSPPGSPVPGILQARTLECVAISFSNAWKWKVKVKSLSRPNCSDPIDCSPPGSSIHGIFQAMIFNG